MRFFFYRLFGIAYCVMFFVYFAIRATSSIGDNNVGWRVFVLTIEFFSSLSVLFMVIVKMRRPWTEFVGQFDGVEMQKQNISRRNAIQADRQRLLEEATPSTNESRRSKKKSPRSRKTPRAQKSSGAKITPRATFTPREIFTPKATPSAHFGRYDLDDYDLDAEILETPVSKLIDSPDSSLIEDIEEEENFTKELYTMVHNLKVPNRARTAGAHIEQPVSYLPYVVRCLIPCYRESIEIVKPTVLAALNLSHDKSKLFVYLCDDGADVEKQEWVESMKKEYPNLEYVTRPTEFKGHGKAGNLNYCLRERIYKEQISQGKKISRREIISIFDADMIAEERYLTSLLPYFADKKKCVMVQSPQTFHNVPMNADFFDAHNVGFFQYMLPSFGAWNITTCCGTNFLVSARALSEAGWFPTISVTEDMYLAMILLSKGGIIEYHAENLVIGEAPQDLRQIFQQRSRWAKGTIQIFIKDNPLFKSGLPLLARLSFFNACWSYFTSAFMNPLFVVVNAAGILFGVFPVKDLYFLISALFVSYYGLFYIMIHFTPVPHKHYTSLWIVGKMGHFFSFMALKAIVNVIRAMLGIKGTITFKVTDKKANVNNEEKKEEEKYSRDSSRKDLNFHWFMSIFILLVIFYGIWLISDQKAFLPDLGKDRNAYQRKGIQIFMTFWMIQFFIAYSLPLWYAYIPENFEIQATVLRVLSSIDSLLSATLIILTALLYKLPFLVRLPQLADITQFPPNHNPFWIAEKSHQNFLGSYIYNSALNSTVPVVVMYNRPSRDEDMFSESSPANGGFPNWIEYRQSLKSMAKVLRDKKFPAAIIFEPDWMLEAMYIPTSTNDNNIDESIKLSSGIKVALNLEKWYRSVNALIELAWSLPSNVNLYIDAGHAQYHRVLEFKAFELLNKSIYSTPNIKGFAFNVANFYPTKFSIEVAEQAYNTYGWNYIIDTSRNGGPFSEMGAEEIQKCRFDPPGINKGDEAQWTSFEAPLDARFVNEEISSGQVQTEYNGLDALLWVKPLGESDGRMYNPGEYRECLIMHTIPCEQPSKDESLISENQLKCLEVPAKVNGKFVRRGACKCD